MTENPVLPPAPDRGPVLLRRDLIADRYSDHTIARLVRGGVLTKLRYGSYVASEIWERSSKAERHLLVARAVLVRAESSAVLSHVTALVAHGAPLWGLPIDEVHLTRTDEKAGRRMAGVVQHRGRLERAELVDVAAMPVTCPARTALDAMAVLPAEVALVAINHLLNSGTVSPGELAQAGSDANHAPGSLRRQVVLRLVDDRIESVAESRFWYLLFRAGLPMPIPQYAVFDGRRVLLGRVDFAWPEYGLFVEIDGRGKYREHRRDGDDVVDTVLREKDREDAIRAATGWRCLRLTWRDLEDPERTAALVRDALAGRMHHR